MGQKWENVVVRTPTFNSKTGQAKCESCPDGTLSFEDRSNCGSCPAGTYVYNELSCVTCSAGKCESRPRDAHPHRRMN